MIRTAGAVIASMVVVASGGAHAAVPRLPALQGPSSVATAGAGEITNPVIAVHPMGQARVAWIDVTAGRNIYGVDLPSNNSVTICSSYECSGLTADGPMMSWADFNTGTVDLVFFDGYPKIFDPGSSGGYSLDYDSETIVYYRWDCPFLGPCQPDIIYGSLTGNPPYILTYPAVVSPDFETAPAATSYLGTRYFAYEFNSSAANEIRVGAALSSPSFSTDSAFPGFEVARPTIAGKTLCWEDGDWTGSSGYLSFIRCTDWDSGFTPTFHIGSDCSRYLDPRLSGGGRYLLMVGQECVVDSVYTDASLWLKDMDSGIVYLVDTDLVLETPASSRPSYLSPVYDVNWNDIVYLKASGSITDVMRFTFDESAL